MQSDLEGQIKRRIPEDAVVWGNPTRGHVANPTLAEEEVGKRLLGHSHANRGGHCPENAGNGIITH